MRPNGVETIRGIQAALMEELAPEIRSEFAQSVMHTVQMLLESLAAEWDTAALDLERDNRALSALLSECAGAIRALPKDHDRLDSLVPGIEGVLAGAAESLAISALHTRNNELNGVLERVLVTFEDVVDVSAYAPLSPVRRAIYEHLRDVAARGWSLWDAVSFRERIARGRTA